MEPTICLFIVFWLYTSVMGVDKHIPQCVDHIGKDVDEYYRYSLPAEYFITLEEPTDIDWTALEDDNLEDYMKKMPIDDTYMAAIFGYYKKNRYKDFRVVFGNENTAVFWFKIVDGDKLVDAYGTHDFKLPKYFSIVVDFLRWGIKVSLYEMPDAVWLNSTCLPWRVYDVPITHIALFSPCDGIEFHMINVEDYLRKQKLCTAASRNQKDWQQVSYRPTDESSITLTDGTLFNAPITGYIDVVNQNLVLYHSNIPQMNTTERGSQFHEIKQFTKIYGWCEVVPRFEE